MKSWREPLTLERLEDRTLMSTCHVTRLSDIGAGMGFRGDFRYCISKVNAEPGADTIILHRTGTINLTGALPILASDIDIQGPGASLLTVRRDTGGNYRILTVASDVSVQVSGLTLANGYLFSTTETMRGGGIYNEGSLAIRDSVVRDNSAIANGGTPQQHAFGGGIYNADGVLTIERSTISNNLAESFFHSAIGGGVYNADAGEVTIIDSTVGDNRARGDTVFGGGLRNSGAMSIYNSTISGNVAEGVPFADGGGIYTSDGFLLVQNSTVYGNDSFGTGGGIANQGGLTIISHSTVSSNHADLGQGGMVVRTSSTTFVRNSILANNSTSASGDCPDVAGNFASSDHNLIGLSECGSGYGANDILDVDPMLGPLQDNGGPTLTTALLPGSPAIDAGDNADAPEFDQRGPGFPRNVNGTIDIGAFEVQSSPVPRPPRFLAFLITADTRAND